MICIIFFCHYLFVIFTSASRWSHYRRLITPSFNSNSLRNYFDIFVEQSLIFTDQFAEKVASNEREELVFLEYILKYTLNTTLGKTKNKYFTRYIFYVKVCHS